MTDSSGYIVAVVGGATAGSVAAEILAEHGIEVVVIEQNDRPYGKIEDGLPRWHVEQRRQEYAKIDARLNRPSVSFVPRTTLGTDLAFDELVEQWGLSAVILANGAWRDRPLPIEGAARFVGCGLQYQNPFIYWFNHKDEAGYDGPPLHVPPRPVVVGGGLASLDVVKVCQIELYRHALWALGHDSEVHELEAKGIPAVCERLGVDPESLGVEDALLIYRRSVEDMPLAQPPDQATPEQLAKTRQVRRKILERAQEKMRFRVRDQLVPVGIEAGHDGHVSGLRVQHTELVDGRVVAVPGSDEVLPTRLIVSSIGSIPERIPGIEMRGETYAIADTARGIYAGAEGVFAVGNVVTGQGNIRASMIHSKGVTEYVSEEYHGQPARAAAETAAVVAQHVRKREPLAEAQTTAIRERVRALQARAGYQGDYEAWIRRVTPPDLA